MHYLKRKSDKNRGPDPDKFKIQALFDDKIFQNFGWSKHFNAAKNRISAGQFSLFTTFLTGMYIVYNIKFENSSLIKYSN